MCACVCVCVRVCVYVCVCACVCVNTSTCDSIAKYDRYVELSANTSVTVRFGVAGE